jgi:uncharacterized membrane protein YdjX (TVP38/TMEM64 family)
LTCRFVLADGRRLWEMKNSSGPFGKLRWGLGIVFLAAIVAGLTVLPIPQCPKWFLERIAGLGSWGPVFFVALYAIVCLVFLPGSVLTLAGGFMFGMMWGAVTASIGATLGATAAFLIARLVLRGRIDHRLATHPKLVHIDRAIGGQGFQIVLLVRLCSLFPYDLMSYVFGLTDVSLGRYVLATWLGRLPEILVFAYVGSTAKSITDLVAGKVEFGLEQQILMGLGLAAMVAAVIVVVHVARKALHEVVDDPAARRTD